MLILSEMQECSLTSNLDVPNPFGCCSSTSQRSWQQVCLQFIQDKHTPITPKSKDELLWSSGPSLHHVCASGPQHQHPLANSGCSCKHGLDLYYNFSVNNWDVVRYDLHLKGQLKVSVAWQVSGGQCAIVLLANNFLHLNQNSVPRRWAPTPLSPLLFVFLCLTKAACL